MCLGPNHGHVGSRRRLAGGDLKPRRKLTRKLLRGSVLRVVCVYVELKVSRIQRWQWMKLGWLEIAGTEVAETAGVRLSTGEALRLADGRAKRQGGLLGAPGARWCHWTGWRCLGARTSPAIADGGFGRQ